MSTMPMPEVSLPESQDEIAVTRKRLARERRGQYIKAILTGAIMAMLGMVSLGRWMRHNEAELRARAGDLTASARIQVISNVPRRPTTLFARFVTLFEPKPEPRSI